MEQFNQYFLATIKERYAKFEGRATRSEFWYYTLFYFILTFVAALLDTAIINPMLGATPQQAGNGGFLEVILALALFIPTIALSIRRLHDIGKSGWWLLLAFVPIVGFFVLLYFYVQDSQPGSNMYGENPKGL